MKNRKELSIVEILAIIIIIGVIIIMITPQIVNITISSKLKLLNSSAKIIIKNAEQDYLAHKSIDDSYNLESVLCSNVAKLNEDYGSCIIIYNEKGEATIDLIGKDGGKFNNLECIGNKSSLECKNMLK